MYKERKKLQLIHRNYMFAMRQANYGGATKWFER